MASVIRIFGLGAAAGRRAAAVMLLGVLVPAAAFGHAVLHERMPGEAVILRLSFPGGDAPLFEPYEVYAPGSETPFQAGRVNAQGELSFRPDRAGEWQVKVFTADGHGTTIDLVVDELAKVESVAAAPDHAHGYPGRVLAGLGYLLGLFGFWSLWRARRARSGAG